MAKQNRPKEYLLIGSGIMSATLGDFLKKVEHDCKITLLERLHGMALESTAAWNNAGTGHAGMCELNYTPEKPDGSINCEKALHINEQFEVSKQFWAWLVSNNLIPGDFIQPVPHMSFVQGKKEVQFLEKRVKQLNNNHLFKTMKFSKNPETIKKWIPLMMNNRRNSAEVAASRMDEGADVNFGYLARYLINYLRKQEGVGMMFGWEVNEIKRRRGKKIWQIEATNRKTEKKESMLADFVFIGAGGKALSLLGKSGIPERKGYGGFPVGGQWLRCNNREVIQQHDAKVYGKAAKGAHPMSVPHLDTRTIRGQKELLFGPFATFSTKFLKHGSYLDLPASLRANNVLPMLKAGIDNLSLTKYLIQQVRLKPEQKIESLKTFYPNAKLKHWDLTNTGQGSQIIKKDKKGGGVLAFGTEVVHSKDGTLAALLGASPGASTSVNIILDVLEKCFGDMVEKEEVQDAIKEMIPSYGQSLINNEALA